MTKAISPSEVVSLKRTTFPATVIETWNELIAKKWTQGSARIDQDEAISALSSATGTPRHQIFDNGWLDIEDIYRAQGWSVVYDKPGYCENYVANFTFTAKG